VFAHITNIMNMQQFPVHTEHTNILHSLHTSFIITYSNNGHSSYVLMLQKRLWTQFEPKVPFTFIKSMNFNFYIQVLFLHQTSKHHTTTSRRFCNMPSNNNDISYIGTYRITQYITKYITEHFTHRSIQYNP